MVKANFLQGMKAICEFTGFSESTILQHKKAYPGMPVDKMGGVWVGDPDGLNEFYKAKAAGDMGKYLNKANQKKQQG
jgi:hypothetical protein